MSKPNSFFAHWWVPTAVTLFCLLFAGSTGLAFDREILFLSVLGMPVPLFLFWTSWNVKALQERYQSAEHSAATVASVQETANEARTLPARRAA